LKACKDFRITAIVGVPPMYQAFAQAPTSVLDESLSTLRLLTSGAAPLDPDTLVAMRKATGLNVYEGYGLTETGPWSRGPWSAVWRSPVRSVARCRVSTCGWWTPTANPTRTRTTRAWSRSVAPTSSPATGRRRSRPRRRGLFRTGDVGYLDPDGDLHLVDRANDLIIVNGFNVYPHEVEQVLAELSEVAEAAAVGVPDERTGERVKAVLVLRDDATLTEEQVHAHCSARLAKFKVPGPVEFVDTLPHSITGKLRRASCVMCRTW